MQKFKVTIVERVTQKYVVEAESAASAEETALENFLQGDPADSLSVDERHVSSTRVAA